MVKVSIIVPCFNQAQYLSEALESVYKQSFTDWECIIVNDGSIDNTNEVSNIWLQKDDRFKYIEIENGGVSNARNVGIKFSKGECILPLDADDKIGIEYLNLAIKEFVKNEMLKVVYCNAELFGEENRLWELGEFSLKKLAISNRIFCSAIFKKNDWKRIGGYDSKMITGLEDWEFWIALLKNGGDVSKLDNIGFFYRIKSNSRNNNYTDKQEEEMFKYINIKHADFFVKQFGSFNYLHKKIRKIKTDNYFLKNNKKHVFNSFTKTFFGFKLFKL